MGTQHFKGTVSVFLDEKSSVTDEGVADIAT